MQTIYFIKAVNKVNNKLLGYITNEVYDGVQFGTVADVIKNEYYWLYNNYLGVQGAHHCANHWAKKFASVEFSVEHTNI